MKIFQRLGLIVLLAAIPLGALQGVSLREQFRRERSEIASGALRAANRAGAEQRRIIDGSRQLLAALSQLPAVQEGDAQICSLVMKRLEQQFPMYLGLGVSDPEGRIWCSSTTVGTDISDRAYFKRAVASRQFTTGGYIIGRVTGRRSLNFSLPFTRPSGQLAGVLVAGLDLERVAEDLATSQLPPDARLVILGPDRRVLVDLPGNMRVGELLPQSLQESFNAQRPGTVETKWFDARDRLVGFIPPGADASRPFFIAVGIDRDRALSIVAKRGFEEAALLALTLAAALLLAWWFATRFVRRPVAHLASTVIAWREGDTKVRVGQMDVGSEFEDLGQAFDTMAEAVDERQRRLRAALESTTDSVLVLSPEWVVIFLNERARVRLNGTELLGKKLFEVFPDVTAEHNSMAVRAAMVDRRPVIVDFDYEPLAARFEVNAFPTPDGGLTLFIRDVTEQHRAREELRYLALHDSLTGLPNRNNAMSVAEQKMADHQLAAILMIDLDGFKHVNDSFGHLMGDEILREAAYRLTDCLGHDGMIARWGGDEFVALLFGNSPQSCETVGQRIVNSLGLEPFAIRGRIHAVTSSCGIVSVLGGTDESIADLLVNADLALYRAKEAGGGTCRVYTPADRDTYEARRLLVEELGRAVTEGEFELHYQPQIRLHDGIWVGAEALLRWRHPQRGLLAPAAFIDILENSRHAQAVGYWVLDEACREAAHWWRNGKRLRIAVNLFAEQIRSGDLPAIVQAILGKHGLPAEGLELELTEGIALAQEEGITTELLALRRLGVSLAFDDFGTGFASLTTLKTIPVHRLKIDRGFVAQLPSNRHDKAIVEAVLALARTLDLEVTAEGVETAEQEEYLRSRGCGEAQGFRYARGMPAETFRTAIFRPHELLTAI